MEHAEILRLLRFEPTAHAAFIDELLRDRVAPSIAAHPLNRDVYVARQGSEAGDARVVASVWADGGEGGEGPAALPETDALRDAGIELTAEPTVIVSGPLRISLRFPRTAALASLIRVFHGEIVPGHEDEYIELVRAGAIADGEANDGTVGLHLAMTEPHRFVTVSAWRDWTAIEQATGGDVRRPMATRHAHMLAAYRIEHFEAITGLRSDAAAPASETPSVLPDGGVASPILPSVSVAMLAVE
ncbi:MAG: hypothetical protein ACJ77N_15200 [Chloroflexota bacterium]